jgi:hypothetical protein
MRTVIAALLLSIVITGSAVASPFTAIGLPYVFGHESQTSTTGWWAFFQAAIDQDAAR